MICDITDDTPNWFQIQGCFVMALVLTASRGSRFKNLPAKHRGMIAVKLLSSVITVNRYKWVLILLET